MTGGGKKSGSGRGKPTNKAPAQKGGKLGGAASIRIAPPPNVQRFRPKKPARYALNRERLTLLLD